MQDFTRHTYAVYAYCDYNSVTKCLFNKVGISLSLFIDRKEDFVQKARQKGKVLLRDFSIVFHFPQRQNLKVRYLQLNYSQKLKLLPIFFTIIQILYCTLPNSILARGRTHLELS